MPDTVPTLAGFVTFCRSVAGITLTVMPDGDPGFDEAFAFSQEWIPKQLNTASPLLFTAATYNWGVSLILEFQPDQSGENFFKVMRDKYKVNNFVPGVISSAADQATSESLTVGEALANMSIVDLQRAADPFGRRALGILMKLGPLWGLS